MTFIKSKISDLNKLKSKIDENRKQSFQKQPKEDGCSKKINSNTSEKETQYKRFDGSCIRNEILQTTDIKECELFEFLENANDTLDTHRDSKIASFYAGRSVFITGASGFVGKCLLEKLLRSCPNINLIYILVRPKRGLEVGERVDALLRSQLFARLRNSADGERQLSKVVAVKGDITKPLFGLSMDDIIKIGSKVSIVFHSAATVKFVEPLKIAIQNNVVSVDNLISFASKLSNLEALIHVSTAYSNCDRDKVEEIFYEPPIEADKLLEMSEWMDPKMFESLAPTLIGKRPNTYTYTKAVAEALLTERVKKLLPNLPIAVVRPSIVTGIWRSPISGWVDNFNGPTGVILSMVTGAIQAMIGRPDYCADIVPVDIVTNLIICTAWQVHQQHHNPIEVERLTRTENQLDVNCTNENTTIFNCVSGPLNPVTWRLISEIIAQTSLVYPCNTLIRRPGTLLISNEYLFNVFDAVNHQFVAHLTDMVMKLLGKKPQLVMMYGRMIKMITTLKPFTTNQWLFECSNVTCLYDRLSPVDREIFNFDIRQVSWDDYLKRYYVGSKLFALKDDPNKLKKARYNLTRMTVTSRVVQTLLFLIIYYFLMSGSPIEEYALNLVRGLIPGYEE